MAQFSDIINTGEGKASEEKKDLGIDLTSYGVSDSNLNLAKQRSPGSSQLKTITNPPVIQEQSTHLSSNPTDRISQISQLIKTNIETVLIHSNLNVFSFVDKME